jgi:cytosine/adenosine deaminase-related metal-dependent hydrolase
MDKFLIYKNALVATFDEQNNCGVYNIIIKNEKIYDIDFDNRLSNDEVIKNIYPKSEIIDAKHKLIIPPFINSHLCSSYSLNKVFLKRNNYDTIHDNVSLNLLNKYFSNIRTKSDFKNLLKINYFNALTNGEYIVNETSSFISKEYFLEDRSTGVPYGMEVSFTSYDGYLNSYLWNSNMFHFISLKYDEEINNYSLNFLKKGFAKGKNKIFLENLRSKRISEEVNGNFGKSFVKVLNDYDLLSSDLVLSNPFTINSSDIGLLSDKKVNVILCICDLLNLSASNINLNDFFNSDINVCIGTGYLGENVLAEIKSLSRLVNINEVSYETLLRSVIVNPAKIFDRTVHSNSLIKNGPANMIIFDLSDLRSFFDFPENDINYVSQHIIESLDTKDIADLMVKGNYLIKDYQSKFYEPESLRKNIKELSVKLYDIGKYFELKEKYLMRRRIKKLTGRYEEKTFTNEDNFAANDIDNQVLENPGMISDSEFKVIGAKVNENLILSSDIISADDNVFKNINEILSFDSGLSVFGTEDSFLGNESKRKNRINKGPEPPKKKIEKIFFDDFANSTAKHEADNEKKESLNSFNKKTDLAGNEPAADKHPEDKKVIFKKNKLRFGFNSEES